MSKFTTFEEFLESKNKNFFTGEMEDDATFFPEGTMSKSTKEIVRVASSKKYAPKGLGSAIQYLTYYLNRAGKGLDADQRKRIERAREILQKKNQEEKANESKNPIPYEESKIINKYQGWSRTLNNSIHTGKLNNEEKEFIKKIDNFIEKSVNLTSKNLVLYRGISEKRYNEYKNIIGESFTYKAFLSTTINKEVARDFAGIKGKVIEIRINEKIPFIYLTNSLEYLNEEEYLLPRNLNFKIKEINDTIVLDQISSNIHESESKRETCVIQIECTPSAKYNLMNILKEFERMGNMGCTRSVTIEDFETDKSLQFDGDGPDRIISIKEM